MQVIITLASGKNLIRLVSFKLHPLALYFKNVWFPGVDICLLHFLKQTMDNCNFEVAFQNKSNFSRDFRSRELFDDIEVQLVLCI